MGAGHHDRRCSEASPFPEDAGIDVVAVLGMHRSGTSCLAGSLQHNGLHLGDVQESNPHNRKGNREHLRIVRLNDAVLAHAGGAWNRPPDRVEWTRAHAAERDAIVADMEATADGPWGFKDPRTVLTLPFWRERLPRVRLVGSFRHPAQVARSLHARSRFPAADAFVLWMSYNTVLLREHARAPFPLLCFDRSPDAYLRDVDAVVARLGLTGAPGGTAWFEESLRGAPTDGLPAVPDDALRLYDDLLRAAEARGA